MTNEPIGWEAAYRKRRSGEHKPHQDAEFLDGLFRKHQVRRILDLGCGDGRHLVYFAKRGYEMFGLDYAPTGLRLAKEWFAKEGLSAKLVCLLKNLIILMLMKVVLKGKFHTIRLYERHLINDWLK